MALDFPNAPSPGEVFDSWEWDGTKWIPAPGDLSGTTVQVSFFFSGTPAANQDVLVAIAIPLDIPADLVGSYAVQDVAPADGDAVFSVQQNGTTVGTITLAQNIGSPTFSSAGFSLAAGDALGIVAPGTPDSALSNAAFSILATRA